VSSLERIGADQRGIAGVAGKSPIAEGRCDLREAGIRWLLAIFGCQRAVRRSCVKLGPRCGELLVLRCRRKSQALVGPCPVPVRLLEVAPWVLG